MIAIFCQVVILIMSQPKSIPLSTRYSSFSSAGDAVPNFGEDMRKEFLLDFDAGTAFCNQAAYGICPKRVLQYRLEKKLMKMFFFFCAS